MSFSTASIAASSSRNHAASHDYKALTLQLGFGSLSPPSQFGLGSIHSSGKAGGMTAKRLFGRMRKDLEDALHIEGETDPLKHRHPTCSVTLFL